jgi:hypothetical protein
MEKHPNNKDDEMGVSEAQLAVAVSTMTVTPAATDTTGTPLIKPVREASFPCTLKFWF